MPSFWSPPFDPKYNGGVSKRIVNALIGRPGQGDRQSDKHLETCSSVCPASSPSIALTRDTDANWPSCKTTAQQKGPLRRYRGIYQRRCRRRNIGRRAHGGLRRARMPIRRCIHLRLHWRKNQHYCARTTAPAVTLLAGRPASAATIYRNGLRRVARLYGQDTILYPMIRPCSAVRKDLN